MFKKLREFTLTIWSEGIILILLSFSSAYSLKEVYNSEINLFSKITLTIALLVFGIMALSKYWEAQQYHIIKILKISNRNLPCTIQDLKEKTVSIEEDVILRAISNYEKQVSLKYEINKQFNSEVQIYEYFKALDYRHQRYLISELPLDYQSYILKRILKEADNT